MAIFANLYKALDFLKKTADQGIVLQPVPLNPSTVTLAYSDSSWANAQGSASQHGQLVLLAPGNITETSGVGALVDWKSGRAKRVCRSTLAAEAVSADSATDRLAYVSYALGELMFGIPAHKVGHRLKTLLVTDCKSLYDCVAAENPNIEDRRSLVNVRSVQELISSKTVHWVPTFLQKAGCLTKVDANLMMDLLAWLQKPLIHLREEGVLTKKKLLPVWISAARSGWFHTSSNAVACCPRILGQSFAFAGKSSHVLIALHLAQHSFGSVQAHATARQTTNQLHADSFQESLSLQSGKKNSSLELADHLHSTGLWQIFDGHSGMMGLVNVAY